MGNKKIDFDTAIDEIEAGKNPTEILEKVNKRDYDAVQDYLNAFGD